MWKGRAWKGGEAGTGDVRAAGDGRLTPGVGILMSFMLLLGKLVTNEAAA